MKSKSIIKVKATKKDDGEVYYIHNGVEYANEEIAQQECDICNKYWGDEISYEVEITEMEKPMAKVIGEDGNVFNLIGICTSALKRAKMQDEAKEMQNRILKCASYEEALCIMSEYCELI